MTRLRSERRRDLDLCMLDVFATLGQRLRVSASEVFNHLLSGPGSSAYLASNLHDQW
jgi:hypothetical protein